MANNSETKVKVEELKIQLLTQIQNFCRRQIDIWSQVPELARKANELRGYSCGRYHLAYSCDVWPISPVAIHGLSVNLKTGELSSSELLEGISLNQLPKILEQLEAEKVVGFLREEIATKETP